MASFDISKAFDSVNLESLNRALTRIKLSRNIKKIILNLLSNRSLKISTSQGLTNPLSVFNGLDQGEVLSPLLWTIFYDPLITKLQNLGTATVLAYMDDLAILAKNLNTLQ